MFTQCVPPRLDGVMSKRDGREVVTRCFQNRHKSLRQYQGYCGGQDQGQVWVRVSLSIVTSGWLLILLHFNDLKSWRPSLKPASSPSLQPRPKLDIRWDKNTHMNTELFHTTHVSFPRKPSAHTNRPGPKRVKIASLVKYFLTKIFKF